MIRAATTALALLPFMLPSPGVAKDGPRISDINTQKEAVRPLPRRGRYFHGLTTRMSISQRGPRHYPGVTRYPTIRLERATSK
jgi:hypothetical protein